MNNVALHGNVYVHFFPLWREWAKVTCYVCSACITQIYCAWSPVHAGTNPTYCVTLQETNGGGVISYLTAFEQLCVEFARVLPLDNTVTVSNVTGPNQDYLTTYSWSCGPNCGYGGYG